MLTERERERERERDELSQVLHQFHIQTASDVSTKSWAILSHLITLLTKL